MRFGRFSQTPAHPFGRRGAGEHSADEPRPSIRGRTAMPAESAGRAPRPIDADPAPGWHVHPRREVHARGEQADEDRPEYDPDTASRREPSPDGGGEIATRGSDDGEDRFAGLAAPSRLVAELAASVPGEAPRGAENASVAGADEPIAAEDGDAD